MRFKLPILFVLVVYGIRGYAQRISLDTHAGYYQSRIVDHPNYDESLNKATIGLGACYHLNTYLAGVAELNYEQKGGEGTISMDNAYGYEVLSYSQTQQLFYVTLPLMIRGSIGNKKLRCFVNAGGYYGFLAGAWVNPQTQNESHKVVNKFNRNDLGLTGGLGLEYYFSAGWGISLEWRMNRGFVSIAKDENNQYNLSNGLMLGVRYVIEQTED